MQVVRVHLGIFTGCARMNDLDEKIKDALIKMHVYERDHNKISYVHTKELLQLFFEVAPVDEKEFIKMMRVSSGMSTRYVREYLDGFRLWKIIFRENGMLYSEKTETEQTTITAEIYPEKKIKKCIKNQNKIMDETCTIEKCKSCGGAGEL